MVKNMQIKRDDYRAIKKMNKPQLTAYLSRIWRRGYEEGLKANKITISKSATEEAVEE